VKLDRCQPGPRRRASRNIGQDSCRCNARPSPDLSLCCRACVIGEPTFAWRLGSIALHLKLRPRPYTVQKSARGSERSLGPLRAKVERLFGPHSQRVKPRTIMRSMSVSG
jgi:hypothetical protein